MNDGGGGHKRAAGRGRFEIGPEDTIAAAAACVIGRNERRLRRHAEQIARSDDPEEVHDARVAARRIRSAFDVFDRELPRKEVREFRRELRRVTRSLATIRDLDVLLGIVASHREAAREAGSSATAATDGLEPLVGAWTAERRAAMADVRDEISSARFRRGLKDLRGFARDQVGRERRAAAGGSDRRRGDPSVPVRLGAGSRILRAYEQLAAFRIDPLDADVETLHLLRIAGKRLRYAIEAFEDVLPPDAADLRDEVVRLQNDAGALHDDVVAARRARRFLSESLEPSDSSAHGDHSADAADGADTADGANAADGGTPRDRSVAAIDAFARSRDDDIVRLRQTLAERLPHVTGPEFRSRLCSIVLPG